MTKYGIGSREKCLYCQTIVKFESPANNASRIQVIAQNEQIELNFAECPHCRRLIVTLETLVNMPNVGYTPISEQVIWPLSGGRPPAPAEVPGAIAQDYNEAALILPLSAKASAALSRRCLQSVLADGAKSRAKDLSKQIDEVLPSLPGYIAKNLDFVRNIGNFAAHEQKAKDTGLIMDVEPGEAEWTLEILDTLFDFYYVKPKIEEQKRVQFDAKLAAAGKPPLKQP